MATEQPKRPWEQQLRDAAAHLETDLKNVVRYINDEVVPDVRKNGSEALRAAAVELHKLAQRIDDHARRTATPPTIKGRAEAVTSVRSRLRCCAFGARAGREWLPSGDDPGLSATTAAGDEYGCEP